jgi:hypothetical protein
VNRPVLVAWILLALWSTWLHALQGLWAASSPWAPDLGVVLLVVLIGRVPRDLMLGAALSIALGRIAVSIDPPAAVLAGYLVPLALLGGLRSVVVIREGLARAVLAGVASALLAEWLAVVHEARAGGALALTWFEPDLAPPSLRMALATAGVALILGPALARLPGMTLLTRRRPWEVAASGR